MKNAFLATADGGTNWIGGEIPFGVLPRLFLPGKINLAFLDHKNCDHIFFSHFLRCYSTLDPNHSITIVLDLWVFF